MKILVTGCAGFIGHSLTKKLLDETKSKIIGIDNINNYYSVKLKNHRLKNLKKNNKFKFYKKDINDYSFLNRLFKKEKINYVIHLAAQAGVRESRINPKKFLESNIKGFFNVLEISRIHKVKHFIFASSSSVYGDQKKFPINERIKTNPVSFYGATKVSNEKMAFTYSQIYKLPTTALRFFTLYGPYGRPDMALFKFADSISKNKKIFIYNNGNHTRDFTYIDDAVDMVYELIKKIPKDKIPYKCFNIASGKPIKLNKFVKLIELNLNKKAKISYLPLQSGDVLTTHASISAIKKSIKIRKKTSIEEGIYNFIRWYKKYY